jgi:hypothetical protein
MKAESDPITEDEWVVRLVWETKVKSTELRIAAAAFEPLRNDTDGLSFFRLACLNDPADALLAIAESKRAHYAICKVPVSLLATLCLSLRPAPIEQVPGHVVMPEINIADYKADKNRFASLKLDLADIASKNFIRLPIGLLSSDEMN